MRILRSSFDAGAFFLTYLRKKIYCPYRPLTVMIEPTNICNLSCTMCPNSKMTRKQGHMSFDLYRKLIDCNFDYIRHLDLFLLGEPLLHSQIPQMIKYARKFDIWTRIFTNATLLGEKMSKDLISSQLNAITISVDGLNKRRYEKIRKTASYDDILENIQRFLTIRNSSKGKSPHVSVKFINFNFEHKEIQTFVREMKDIGVDSIDGMTFHRWPGVKHDTSKGPDDRRKRCTYHHCVLPWAVISVLWDGKVLGCCDDFNGLYVIGDINNTPYLKEMWNNQRMLALRDSLANGKYSDLPHCKNCDRLWSSPFYDTIFKNAVWSFKELFRL